MRYAAWWVRVWSLAAAMGIGLAVLEWSAGATVVMVAAASLLMSVAVTLAAPPSVSALGPGWGWRRVLGWSASGGVGVVGLLALLAASPPLALLALLVVLATCPVTVRRLRKTVTRSTTGPAEPWPPLTTVGMGDLSDHELCMMWRRTFWDLRTHRTPAGLATTVSLRQACLEELERRDPAAVLAWLHSGTTASEGPEQFWSAPRRTDDAT